MRDAARRIFSLFRKELLAVLKDPATRVVLFAPAIVQTLVFGYAATHDLSDVPYALLDRSHSEASVELVSRLDGSGVFHRVRTLHTAQEIRPAIESGDALMVLHIGQDFAPELNAGRSTAIQVVLDGRNSSTAGAAGRYVGEVVRRFNADRSGAPVGLVIENRAWFNPNLQTRWNLLPGLVAALSMVQTLLLTALSVAREREQGTFDQLLVAPLAPGEIMVGKALPPMLIGLVQSSLVLCVTLFWFRIPMAGSLLTLYAGLIVFIMACVGIGLSISALSLSMQQAMLYTFSLLMPMMLLSGLMTPVANMPLALRLATYANPLRFAVDLVQRVYLEGVGFATVAPNFIPMALVAAFTLPLAAWLFRNRLV
jgi:ABC-2 type transport system permease protein